MGYDKILESRMLGKRTDETTTDDLSNICERTSYKSVKKRAEDRCLRRVLEMEVNDLLFIAVHQKK